MLWCVGLKIAKGTAQRLVRDRSAAVVQVRSSDVVQSARGLESARATIERLDSGPLPGGGAELASAKWVSGVVPTPTGPMLWMDLGEDLSRGPGSTDEFSVGYSRYLR